MFVRLLTALATGSFLRRHGDVVPAVNDQFGRSRSRWRLSAQIASRSRRSQVVVVIWAHSPVRFRGQTYFQFNKLGILGRGRGGVGVDLPRAGTGPDRVDGPGRVGASMSAEIGTMKVTEQIDALRALAVHPVDYRRPARSP
jgi:phospholipid/cholesterol/gamma-HCH transport system permease protein